jgi:hypothetical protein
MNSKYEYIRSVLKQYLNFFADAFSRGKLHVFFNINILKDAARFELSPYILMIEK